MLRASSKQQQQQQQQELSESSSKQGIRLFGMTIKLQKLHHPDVDDNNKTNDKERCEAWSSNFNADTNSSHKNGSSTTTSSSVVNAEDADVAAGTAEVASRDPTCFSDVASRDPACRSDVAGRGDKPRKPDKPACCPRCDSMDTKFCYYNNYNINQPRHFCKSCQRYWTSGGTLRNVPVGAGRRKTRHLITAATASAKTSALMSKLAAANLAAPLAETGVDDGSSLSVDRVRDLVKSGPRWPPPPYWVAVASFAAANSAAAAGHVVVAPPWIGKRRNGGDLPIREAKLSAKF